MIFHRTNFIRLIYFLLLLLVVLSCEEENGEELIQDEEPEEEMILERTPIFDSVFTLTADFETTPVHAGIRSDAADDPAIWIHPERLEESMVIGSNKEGGVSTYTLNGQEIRYFEFGRINNIDVLYNYDLNGTGIDLCGGTNRTTQTIDIWRIVPETGDLQYILTEAIHPDVDDVYGFCFYRSPSTGKSFAFVCGKDGNIEQHEIMTTGDSLSLSLVRTIQTESQTEGLVADHRLGHLYIGEEEAGIWKYDAEPGGTDFSKLQYSDEVSNPNIEFDIEGLTIYYTSRTDGYLLASSQGNDTYAVYQRALNNEYIGSFSIGVGTTIDGAQETDGIDVINLNLGADYPMGFFVAQDGSNVTDRDRDAQNYKLVRWEKIANLFDPPLTTDPGFNVRALFE